MTGPKSIIDVAVNFFSQLPGKFTIIRCLFIIEPQVFEKQDLAVEEISFEFIHLWPDHIRGEENFARQPTKFS